MVTDDDTKDLWVTVCIWCGALTLALIAGSCVVDAHFDQINKRLAALEEPQR